MAPQNQTLDLDTFLMNSWGKCAPNNYDLNLPLSRVCPLAGEVYKLIGVDFAVPPSFACAAFRKQSCPAESWVVDAVVTLAEENESAEFERRMKPLLDFWRGENAHEPHILANIEAMVAEVVAAYRLFQTKGIEPQTGRWHDNQCSLYELLRFNHT